MENSQQLERITLDGDAISMHRLRGSGVMYYHWHQCVEFLYISEGYGIVVVDNQHYTARPGRLFVFPPFRLHKVQVESSEKNPYHRTAMHIDHNAVAQALASFPRHQLQFTALSASNGPARVFDLSEQKDFMNLILDQFCAREKTAQQSVSEVAFVVMQIMAFLPAEAETLIHQQETLAARIMQWLEEHYSEKFQLDDLANAMGLSRSYTSRIFRQQTGGSLHEYLLTRRIKKSCDLLRGTALSVSAIAQKVGFVEMTYYITCFKKMLGQTPLQYRKQYQQNALTDDAN